eukprot:gnl/MRDRNA2_/MRDRNA2_77067_c0_seq1.p1 gnl/MRDRNA2_/MRDRNA2_77067_c0~~gnl/MRDRNA2_/MRDRNA2_77067_c0_seq1.p1  ORF type:complete len:183 (+),score=28.58 gnl/MRDRNA2_/MRDRNA2_77067_c0_seq1:94-642(+)
MVVEIVLFLALYSPRVSSAHVRTYLTHTTLSNHEQVGKFEINGNITGQHVDGAVGAVHKIHKRKHLNQTEPGMDKHPINKHHNQSQPARERDNQSGWWESATEWWAGQPDQSESSVKEHLIQKHLNQSGPAVEGRVNRSLQAAKESTSNDSHNQSGWWESVTEWWAGNKSEPAAKKHLRPSL